MYSKCAVAPRIDAPQADDRVDPPGLRGRAGRLRDLERPRHGVDLDVACRSARLRERRQGAVAQLAGDRDVEARHDDGEAQAGSVGQRAGGGIGLTHGISTP